MIEGARDPSLLALIQRFHLESLSESRARTK